MTAVSRHNLAPDNASAGSAADLMARLALAQARLGELEALLESSRQTSQQSEEALSPLGRTLLLDNLHDCIFVVERDGKIVHVAGNCVGLLGYDRSELTVPGLELHLHQLIDPRDLPAVQAEFRDARERPRRVSFQARVIDQAGEWRWIEFTLAPLFGEPDHELSGFQVILRDISERVQAESMMRSLNEAAQTVQKASLSLEDVLEAVSSQLRALDFFCAIGLLDPSGQSVRWVKFRADERRMQTLKSLDIRPLSVSRAMIPAFDQALATGRPVQQILDEALLTAVLRDPILVRQTAQLVGPLTLVTAPLRADGRVLGFLVVGGPSPRPESMAAIEAFANQTSIAIRNAQLVERIAERESQYRAIFEAARDGLIVLDSQAKIVSASEAACSLFGYRAQAMLGLSLDALLTMDRDQVAQWVERAQADSDSGITQATAIRRGGERFPVELRGSRLGAGSGARLLALITDTTERVRAQEALIQAERLSALGQMAGGIAHDFNNILVSVLGHAQMARDDHNMDSERLAGHLEQIEIAARDAADAVSRLQSLYRAADDRSDFVAVQWDDILMEALALNRPRWKDIPQMRGITFRIETQLGRPAPVQGNPSELRRVLSNLIINAIDAMPNGGTLCFETGEDGPYSYVRVRDTGIGMAPDERMRIFEPFYTTKKSSGLGLTISQNIVERHEGSIEVESELGAGAVFLVRLPKWVGRELEKAPAQRVAPIREREAPARLAVLVVDDERGVRDVLARNLERMGHRVRTADSGQKGIAALEQEQFDLLICDLGMPDVQGPTVMQHGHILNPRMLIVLTTGWGDSITPEQLQSMKAAALLPKPFGQQEIGFLLERVQQHRANAS